MNTKIILIVLMKLLIQISLQDPIVELPNGKIQGRENTTSKGNSYFGFEKIPYALPPIGNLRFQAPQPPENWDGILNTTTIDIACHQLGSHAVTESEDCLFLNVYTPKLPENDADEPLAVMVYLYGGGYTGGWSGEYQPDLYINSDVLLVTLNYRLGIFGYLSTEDEVIPGNSGLKDQLLALQWVHDNIHLFGGDAEKVTIFGQSAGAGSSAYHLLNQNSEGLFSRAILESGTFLNQYSFHRQPRIVAFGVASILNSTFETSQDSETLLEFLLSVDADDLNAAAEEYSRINSHPWDVVAQQQGIWAPVIEVKNPTAFLTKKMYGLLKAGNVLPVPTMMGFTSEECIAALSDVDALKEALEAVDDNLTYLVPDDIPINEEKNRTELGVKIRDIYTNGEPFVDNLPSAVRYCSDDRTTRSMIEHAKLFANIAPTYFYQFSYDGELGGIDVNYEGFGGVGHAEELSYIFCGGETCAEAAGADLLTRQRLIELWTNFAKYENPTPEPSELLQNVTWPQLSTADGDFLYLDIGENLEVKNFPKWGTYEAWTELYNNLDYDDFDTY